MKHLKFLSKALLLLTLAGFGSPEMSGEDTTNKKTTILLVRVNKGKPFTRPKAPDRQVITCLYDGEELFFNFAIPEGSATVTVTDETKTISIYQIDTTQLEIHITVGEFIGDALIEVETELNNRYYGQIE